MGGGEQVKKQSYMASNIVYISTKSQCVYLFFFLNNVWKHISTAFSSFNNIWKHMGAAFPPFKHTSAALKKIKKDG